MDFKNILTKLTLLEGKEESAPSKTKIDESVVLSADDQDAMAILDMIRLAGIEKADHSSDNIDPSPVEMPEPASIDIVEPMDADMADQMPGDDMEMSLDMDDQQTEEFEYGNSPDEKISPMSAAIPSGDDLHKKKKSYHPTNGGDNPMTLDLEERLSKMFESFKKDLK